MKTKRWLRACCLLLAAAAVLAGILYYLRQEKIRQANNAYYEARIQQEKAWIMANRTPDGAILTYYSADGAGANEKRYMNPYFACIAARGLLCGEASAEEKDAVKAYLGWHSAHLAADGSISDYDYYGQAEESDRWQSRNRADSVDSYAALYLILAYEYYDATGDADGVRALADSIDAAAECLLELQQGDGLMQVSPRNAVKYTMDNVEVNLALRDAAALYRALWQRDALLPRLERAYAWNTAAIAALLWDSENEEYAVGLDEKGDALGAPDRGKIYPYWSAQLFPQLFLAEEDPDIGSGRYAAFCSEMQWTDLSFRQGAGASYWCALLYCAARSGDTARVQEYLEAYDTALGEDRGYPYYCAESGWAILAFDRMKY